MGWDNSKVVNAVNVKELLDNEGGGSYLRPLLREWVDRELAQAEQHLNPPGIETGEEQEPDPD
jgi:hypothetical protein